MSIGILIVPTRISSFLDSLWRHMSAVDGHSSRQGRVARIPSCLGRSSEEADRHAIPISRFNRFTWGPIFIGHTSYNRYIGFHWLSYHESASPVNGFPVDRTADIAASESLAAREIRSCMKRKEKADLNQPIHDMPLIPGQGRCNRSLRSPPEIRRSSP